MKKILYILSKLKWIGLIGIIGTINGNSYLKLFWLFFLLGFIDIFENLPVFLQSMKMLIAIPVISIKYGKRLPSTENHTSDTKYILPFEGEWFVVNGGTDQKTSHSWGIVPQRYAYDFFILDEENKSFENTGDNLEDYYCYGKNILAPADGIVVALKNKYPNSNVNKNGKVECKAKDIRGNYITIKHNDKEYSNIAHIMPGSIKVEIGQKVTRGQVIARCGNSGNTSEPHIHYQVNDGKSFFFSAGLPIKFQKVIVDGNKSDDHEQYITREHKVKNS
ncbi:M23 family metallopeptidase [Mobilitalea sibirica]|uniref:M23 family metallopeptidase n=1 Tax=Mobilitalea sibirica TaxID=1462919 RepID=A0A8J7HC50_9FIRM|nr:M23 family metallopeptidase [Mobilitalea sibirica]MBH1942035.1 M23 family metallopeptidase [Mobilitalea sibirica]